MYPQMSFRFSLHMFYGLFFKKYFAFKREIFSLSSYKHYSPCLMRPAQNQDRITKSRCILHPKTAVKGNRK